MTRLVFFLEEPSAREMLKGLLPRLLPGDTVPQYVVFEGKNDMKKQLPKKLRGWRAPDSRFVVLCDKDGADCVRVKSELVEICRGAGGARRADRAPWSGSPATNWKAGTARVLGDLNAVERGTGARWSGLARRQKRAKYRPTRPVWRICCGAARTCGPSRQPCRTFRNWNA